MNTKITKLLNIKCPIIMASMAWVTNAEMVAAVSNAGGLGTLGPNAGSRTITREVDETGERLRTQIRKVKTLTDKPFAVNFIVGSAGLDKAFSEKCVEIGLQEKVPVAIVSQGSPNVYTKEIKDSGAKVIQVCSTVKHARKAESAGVDAVIASGTEGGGHSGFEQSTTFCLAPQVASAVEIPVVAGGGVADGRQLVAALSLGADAVYVGTRFIATKECPAHKNYKQVLISAQDGDTLAIKHGYASEGAKSTGDRGLSVERRGSLRILMNDKVREIIAEHGGLLDYDMLMKEFTQKAENEWESSLTAAYLQGDVEKRFFAAGQSVGLFEGDIISCAELVDIIMEQANTALRKIQNVRI